jgi:hypothetical protein
MMLIEDEMDPHTRLFHSTPVRIKQNTKAHATGGGATTRFNYMPKHSTYLQNTPVSIAIIKIGPFHVSTKRKK